MASQTLNQTGNRSECNKPGLLNIHYRTSLIAGRPLAGISPTGRGVLVVRWLEARPAGRSTLKIASAFAINPRTARRILATLQRDGLVARKGDGVFAVWVLA